MHTLIALLFSGQAHAGCKLGHIKDVTSTMTTVTINGAVHNVRGTANRKAFAAQLDACGKDDAADAFNAWRQARRGVNASAAIGLTVLWPALILTVADAAVANTQRQRMEAALR
mgnify:CR=1 FL=1